MVKFIKNHYVIETLLIFYSISLLLLFNSIMSAETYGYIPKNDFYYLTLSWKYPVFIILLLIIYRLIKSSYKKWLLGLCFLISIIWYLAHPITYLIHVTSHYFLNLSAYSILVIASVF
ncbi:hypothetical protein EFM07_03620 [Lactococcus lactis]|nr:hypothetical protein [Lactococcus lactis]